MYLKFLMICSYLILYCHAMQLIQSPGPPSKYDYNLENQNSIRSTSDLKNTVSLKRSQPDYDSIKAAFYEPINSFSETIDLNAPKIHMTQSGWPKNTQPRSTHHHNAKHKTSIRKHGRNLPDFPGAAYKWVKKFIKKHNSTNVTETSENPLLLSPEDSKENVTITDLMNSYTPEDNQHSDNKVQGNSKNSYNFIKSAQKSAISNKPSTIHHHHHNIQTKSNYMSNPDVMVVMVAMAVIALAAALAGIVVHTRMHLVISRIC